MLKMYNYFTYSSSEDKDDIKEMLQNFDEYFTLEKKKFYLTHFLSSSFSQKKDGETIDNSYAQDLSLTCEFGQLTNSFIKYYIILGIKDRLIKDRILRIEDLDLNKVINVAKPRKV